MRLRHFGVLATRGRTAKRARCRALLTVPPPIPPETVAALLHRLTGVDITCHTSRFDVSGFLHRSADFYHAVITSGSEPPDRVSGRNIARDGTECPPPANRGPAQPPAR